MPNDLTGKEYDDFYRDTQDGRRSAKRRRQDIAENWINSLGIKVILPPRSPISGRYVEYGGYSVVNRWIRTPFPPTTDRQLYVLAEQIARLVFDHNGKRSGYLYAYERQLFAHQLLKSRNINVDQKTKWRAWIEVRTLLRATLNNEKTLIDREVAVWAEIVVPHSRLARINHHDKIRVRIIEVMSAITRGVSS